MECTALRQSTVQHKWPHSAKQRQSTLYVGFPKAKQSLYRAMHACRLRFTCFAYISMNSPFPVILTQNKNRIFKVIISTMTNLILEVAKTLSTCNVRELNSFKTIQFLLTWFLNMHYKWQASRTFYTRNRKVWKWCKTYYKTDQECRGTRRRRKRKRNKRRRRIEGNGKRSKRSGQGKYINIIHSIHFLFYVYCQTNVQFYSLLIVKQSYMFRTLSWFIFM